MSQLINIATTPEIASSEEKYTLLIAKTLKISVEQIACIRIIKKSIDARSRKIKVNFSFEVFIDDERPADETHIEYPNVENGTPIVIVGCGPAGLFAGLRAIELGYKPIIIERGKDVSSRKLDIASINKNNPIDSDSNYAFGEGGAGAYSDGKLYTRSKKRGNHHKALQILHMHGANENILYESRPHIGSDKLPNIIANIRKRIIDCGGEVHFGCRVNDIILENNKAKGVTDINGNKYLGAGVILATGHSARDVYELLYEKGIILEEKNFAMGLRVEHQQELIDKIQYKQNNRDGLLPPASYQVVQQVNGRGVYSFCMCPGGFIVPSATSNGECVVNGMSPSRHNSPFANAGIATEIRTEDFSHLKAKHGVLAGLRYQQELERLAYENGGGMQIAPAQALSDFISGKKSSNLPETSYIPTTISSNMSTWLPPLILHSLQEGFKGFDNKMRGFITNDAQVLGVESRTSSPLRIPRKADTLEHVSINMLFPCGEGAGYAGGIISAGIDGERCVDAFNELIKK